MALNINRIQSQLQRVPDQALIGYVQNPDGQVPSFLALAELTRRKEIRNAGQAQQAPTQSIADQMVGEGLSALPLPETMFNEESYANGGIVSFEEGGEVQRFNKGGKPFVELTDAQILKLTPAQRTEYNNNMYAARQKGLFRGAKSLGASALDAGRFTYAAPLAVLDMGTNALGEVVNTVAGREAIDTSPSALRQEGFAPNYNAFAKANPKTKPAAKPSLTTPAINDPTYVIPPTDKTGDTPAGSRIPSAAGGIGALTFNPMADNSARFNQFQRDEKTPEEQMAMMQGLIGEDTGRKDRAARLEKMEARTAKEEENAPYMALARAGLGMAAGRSQFALQNIAEGAQAGLSDLVASRNRVDIARERQFEIADRMAQAERAEKVATARFGVESSEAIKARNLQTGLAKVGYQNELEMANTKQNYDVQKTNVDIQLQKAKINQDAAQHAQTINMYKERMASADKATAAKLLTLRSTVIKNLANDPAYLQELDMVNAKYKDDPSNNLAKGERELIRNKYIAEGLGTVLESIGDIPTAEAFGAQKFGAQ